jgi:hypothetical protein
VQEEKLVAECDTWGLLGALATSNASRTPAQVPLSTDKALLITAVDAERVLSSQGAATGPLSQCTTPCSTTQPPPEVLAVVHTLREACQPGNAADDSCITEACKTLHEKRVRVNPVVTSALAARLGKASNWNALKQLHRSQPLLSLLQCPHLLSQCVAAGEFGLACHLLNRADEASHDDLAMALQMLLLPVADSPASVAAEAFQRRLRSSASQRLSTAEASLSTSAIHAAAYAAAAVEGFSAYQLPMHAFVAWQQDERAIGSVCSSLSSRAAARLLKYLVRWLHILFADDSLLPSSQAHWCGTLPACVLAL